MRQFRYYHPIGLTNIKKKTSENNASTKLQILNGLGFIFNNLILRKVLHTNMHKWFQHHIGQYINILNVTNRFKTAFFHLGHVQHAKPSLTNAQNTYKLNILIFGGFYYDLDCK